MYIYIHIHSYWKKKNPKKWDFRSKQSLKKGELVMAKKWGCQGFFSGNFVLRPCQDHPKRRSTAVRVTSGWTHKHQVGLCPFLTKFVEGLQAHFIQDVLPVLPCKSFILVACVVPDFRSVIIFSGLYFGKREYGSFGFLFSPLPRQGKCFPWHSKSKN